MRFMCIRLYITKSYFFHHDLSLYVSGGVGYEFSLIFKHSATTIEKLNFLHNYVNIWLRKHYCLKPCVTQNMKNVLSTV